jgi:hypothetical protein
MDAAIDRRSVVCEHRGVPAVSRLLAPIGGVLVAVGVFVPYAEAEGDGYAIFDPDQLEFTWGFAFEPLAVAIASFAPLVVHRVSPRLLAMLLAAIGAQTALMYLGYLLLSTNEAYDPSFGALIGIAGSALIFTAGVIGLRAPATEPAPDTTSLPPSGWYPDPTGEAAERFWDGSAWADHTR